MSNLPFALPACDQPATTRVELFSTDPAGAGSSLDACIYTCDQHDGDAVAAAWGVDMNAYRVVMAPDINRKCGESYVFPTGNLGGEQ